MTSRSTLDRARDSVQPKGSAGILQKVLEFAKFRALRGIQSDLGWLRVQVIKARRGAMNTSNGVRMFESLDLLENRVLFSSAVATDTPRLYSPGNVTTRSQSPGGHTVDSATVTAKSGYFASRARAAMTLSTSRVPMDKIAARYALPDSP